jgi:AbrB family looped-hinge helix DNA binding protein
MEYSEYKAEIQRAGRITIPMEIRKRYDLKEGDILTIICKDGELTIVTRKKSLEHARSLISDFLSASDTTSEDFIKWRRDEAKKEGQDFND